MDAGRPRNVTELVELFYESLYRYAYRLSGSAADADDLTQEAFCKAQSQFKQLRDASRAKPWLFSIVRNLYLHRLRSERQRMTISLDAVAELPDELSTGNGNTDGDLPDVDPETLQQVLDELPELFRTPIILFYFEDFSYRDIAEQMDLPIGTVMSRLARGKASLRQRLFPELFSPDRNSRDNNDSPNRNVKGRATNGL